MKNTIAHIIIVAVALLATACSDSFDIARDNGTDVAIYPDYRGVTIPCNIAPLNFDIESGEGKYAVKIKAGDMVVDVRANGTTVDIPAGKWHRLLEKSKGDSIVFTVCRDENGEWTAYRAFAMAVSPDSIDPRLVYRRLPPLYGTWNLMGIYQRDLSNYNEQAIYTNDFGHGNCVNCHSLCQGNPEKMMFHLRGKGGGTYLTADGAKQRLDTKTDSTLSNFTYPYWHPSGKYIAFSVNNIFQVFHTADPNRIEVCDDASDVVVYDVNSGRAFSVPQLKNDNVMTTFPAFSADGRKLYYCSAPNAAKMPEDYRDVRYSLCSIDFDPASGRLGEKVDTLYRSEGVEGVYPRGSVSFPRPSPDGRFLVATVSDYGNFSIWHKSADLWMLDLATGAWKRLDTLNSSDVESYHSFSRNGRWMVFSSRRDDGLYTRPYIAHIAADGSASKPFMLPQRSPRGYYRDQMCSFNIPEFATGDIDIAPRDVARWMQQPAQKVSFASR